MMSYIWSALVMVLNLPLLLLSSIVELVAWAPYFFAPVIITGFFALVTYAIPVLVQVLYFDRQPTQDLKKKYGASWALVTGASSGIGRGIVEKLVTQKLNIVLVALDDKLLHAFHEELVQKHPDLQFKCVGVDLSRPGYLDTIAAATAVLDVTLVFNNAGFITAGFFAAVPLARQQANYECNATCAMNITHVFMQRMLEKKQRGLFAFTSSSAAFLPNPLTSLYASTKAFLTMFATSVAPEVKTFGIDVVVVHPSPMNTRFFENAGKLSTLNFFKKFAATPDVIADVIFSSAGRTVVRDQGHVTVLLRFLLKVLDLNFLSEIITHVAHTSADFKTFRADVPYLAKAAASPGAPVNGNSHTAKQD